MVARLVFIAVAIGAPGCGIAFGCTAVCASSRGKVLVGNNEDYGNPRTRIWFVPAKDGQHGRMLVGFDNGYPQGGMNEKGLMFDGFATPAVKLPPSPDKQIWFGSLGEKALAECGTVEEVVGLLEKYSRPDRAVLFFADANGGAVSIEPSAVVHKTGWFFVQTNFYQSRVPAGTESCERFKIARRMLEDADGRVNVDLVRRILAATHQEGGAATQYSNIYDLVARTMYLYHFHNYENAVRIDLREELREGPHKMDIPALFPRTYAAEAHARWHAQQQKK